MKKYIFLHTNERNETGNNLKFFKVQEKGTFMHRQATEISEIEPSLELQPSNSLENGKLPSLHLFPR